MKTKNANKNNEWLQLEKGNEYSQKSMLKSLLKSDTELNKNVNWYLERTGNYQIIEELDDSFIEKFESKYQSEVSPIDTSKLLNLQSELFIFETKQQSSPINIFKSVSFQDKEIEELINTHIEQIQVDSDYDIGLDSRFNNKDTLVMDESSEIVINKIQL